LDRAVSYEATRGSGSSGGLLSCLLSQVEYGKLSQCPLCCCIRARCPRETQNVQSAALSTGIVGTGVVEKMKKKVTLLRREVRLELRRCHLWIVVVACGTDGLKTGGS